VGGENVLEMQARYGPPPSSYQVWLGSDIARHQGAKKLDDFCFCLSVTLSNNKVRERHFAMNALEFGNDFGIIG